MGLVKPSGGFLEGVGIGQIFNASGHDRGSCLYD